MKKIASNIGTISTIREIKNAIFGDWESAVGCRYDVYAEDDGTIRVCKHKVSFEEAEKAANAWLNKIYTRFYSKTIPNSFCSTLYNVIVCSYIEGGKLKVGTARFNEKDERYSNALGKALAYSRASGDPLPDEVAEYLGIKQ